MSQQEIKEELIQTDPEFRLLYEDHQASERRLDDLRLKSMPSEEDEAEEKRLKLHKLALKDRMEQILRAHRESQVSA
jgi:uncharacterized protein